MQTVPDLTLLLGCQSAQPEDSRFKLLKFAIVVSKATGLGGATSRTGDAIPSIRQGHIGAPCHRIDADDKTALQLAQVDGTAVRGMEHDTRQNEPFKVRCRTIINRAGQANSSWDRLVLIQLPLDETPSAGHHLAAMSSGGNQKHPGSGSGGWHC